MNLFTTAASPEESDLVQESLVSISEASRMLGVSESALRQWTDEGRIKAFITPGGHRRYSRAELKRFVGSHQKTLGIKDLAVELEDTASVHRELGRTFLENTTWYSRLSEESQKHLTVLGRDLLNLIIKYIAEPSKREEIIKLARDVGKGLAEILAELGLPLTDAVEAFILHRDPIMNATSHMMRKREALTGRVVDAIPLIAHVMDEALVALVAAYQEYRNGTKNEPEEGSTR